MADTKTSALTALATQPASGDLFMVVDVSDTTMDAAGTNKKIESRYVRSQWSQSGWTKNGETDRGVPGNTYTGPNNAGTIGLTANRLAFVPFIIESPITITGAHMEVTTLSTGSIVMGIYNCSTSNGYPFPTTRIATWGTVSVTGTGVKSITSLSTALTPGMYALAYMAEATPTVRAGEYFSVLNTKWANSGSANIVRAVVEYYEASTYSATLPDPFPGSAPPSISVTASSQGYNFIPIHVDF
jgi:hypothetical protein